MSDNGYTPKGLEVLREWRYYNQRQVKGWIARAQQNAAADGRETSANDLRAAFAASGGRLVVEGE